MLPTYLCFLAIFALGLTIAGLGASINIFLANTGVDFSNSRFIVFIKPLGFFLGIYLGEKGIKLFKETHLLSAGFLSGFIILANIPHLTNFTLLLLALFLLGGIEGVMEISANDFLVTLHREKVAPYMNLMHFFFGLGAIISPGLIGWNIEYSESITMAYSGFAFVFLLGGLGFFIPYIKKNNHEKKTQKKSVDKFTRKLVLIISLIFFFYVAAEAVFTVWLFNFTIDVASFTPAQAGLITSLFWVAFTISRLFCTFLSIKWESQTILQLLFFITFIALLIFSFFYKNEAGLFVGSFVLGFSFGGIFPLLLAYAQEKLNLNSLMIRSFLFFACLGSIIFPTVLEPFYQAEKIFFIYFLTILVLSFMGLFFYLQKRLTKKQPN